MADLVYYISGLVPILELFETLPIKEFPLTGEPSDRAWIQTRQPKEVPTIKRTAKLVRYL